MNQISICISGILSGLFGAMGLGGGGVLIIYLTVFACIEQVKAQGINLIFFIPIALMSLIIYSYRKLICWKIIIPASLIGVPSSLIGSYISSKIDGNILSKTFGILLLIIGVMQIFKKNKPHN